MSATKYADYTVRIGDDLERDVYYEYDHPTPLRVHYRAYRIPSRKEFVIRNFTGATEQDRAEAERDVPRIPKMFEWVEHHTDIRRRKSKSGYWFWAWFFGTPSEDPLIQLELEMMIDLDSEVSA